MVDIRLVGTLAIAAIIGSALATLMFAEKIDRTVEVLRDDWQVPASEGLQRLPAMENRYPYSLSLVVRRPVRELVVDFGSLLNTTFKLDYDDWASLDMRQRALRISEVAELDGKVAHLAGTMEVNVEEMQTSIEHAGKKYDLYLLDYSPSLEALAPADVSGSLPTLFAFLFDSSGNLSQYYRGSADFFHNRLRSIEDITVGLNENMTTYSSRPHERPGYAPVSDAPALGRLTFANLQKDDRVSILIAVNGARVGGSGSILQIVRIRVNGKLINPVINFLAR